MKLAVSDCIDIDNSCYSLLAHSLAAQPRPRNILGTESLFQIYKARHRHGRPSTLPWSWRVSGEATVKRKKEEKNISKTYFDSVGPTSALLCDWSLRALPHQGSGLQCSWRGRRRLSCTGTGTPGTTAPGTQSGTGEILVDQSEARVRRHVTCLNQWNVMINLDLWLVQIDHVKWMLVYDWFIMITWP